MKQKRASYLAMLVLTSGLACAQNAVADTEASLQGKALFLRGSWAQNKLKFDGDGKPEKDYGVLPFTESGFEERSVSIKDHTLKIEGKRTGLRFDPKGGMSRSDLGNMTIEIKGDAGTDFNRAVNQIFLPNLAALVPSLPSYWQTYATQHFWGNPTDGAGKAISAEVPDPSQAGELLHIGGAITKPTILSAPTPTYSEAARAAEFSGNVEVYLWVGVDGLPSHLRLVRPAGLGLDEEAIAAVLQYRFAPATKDGKPVKVDLYIDVNFQKL